MKTIALAVQKGGTGKTTTVFNLAGVLANKGKRVLLVDVDPQANLTTDTGITVDPGKDLASVFGDDKTGTATITDIVKPYVKGIDIAPGSIDLAGSEMLITNRKGRENILRKALLPVSDSYDFCLIDTPPSLGLLTINALAAADTVLVPIQPAAHDLQSLQLFLDTIQNMKNINPSLSLLGVILNRYDKRLQLHKQAAEELRAAGLPLVEPFITQSVRITESTGENIPLIQYDPRNVNNAAYSAIADLIIQE